MAGTAAAGATPSLAKSLATTSDSFEFVFEDSAELAAVPSCTFFSSTSCSGCKATVLPLGVVLIVLSNEPVYLLVLGIISIDPCLVGLGSLDEKADPGRLLPAELVSGLSGTISVNPNNLGLRFFLRVRSYESLWRNSFLPDKANDGSDECEVEADEGWTPVRPVISVVSSGARIRVRFFGGDRTDAKQCGAGKAG